MSVEKVSWNRIEDGLCVSCGTELISPRDAELNMCESCLKKSIAAAQKQIKNRKNRSGTVKRVRMKFNPDTVFSKEK